MKQKNSLEEMRITPVEMGIAPLDIAWGLAEEHDPRLRASILHHKGKMEISFGVTYS